MIDQPEVQLPHLDKRASGGAQGETGVIPSLVDKFERTKQGPLPPLRYDDGDSRVGVPVCLL